jgi:histidine triad (HIT) family protein
MSLDGDYDPDNIFAKIVRGEALAAKVYEDHDTLAFMDVFPQGPGHVLVVHKRSHARNLMDADPQDLHAVITTVQRMVLAVRAAMKPDGVFVAQFNGAAAGQTIFHLHFHVIPRWDGVPLGRHGAGGVADMGELRALAEQISREIA